MVIRGILTSKMLRNYSSLLVVHVPAYGACGVLFIVSLQRQLKHYIYGD